MRYEEVLDKAIEMLHEGINEGKITRGAVEGRRYEENLNEIALIAEQTIDRLEDNEVLTITIENKNLWHREPDFGTERTPLGYMRRNLYELIYDAILEEVEE